jgi:hypothetical protein
MAVMGHSVSGNAGDVVAAVDCKPYATRGAKWPLCRSFRYGSSYGSVDNPRLAEGRHSLHDRRAYAFLRRARIGHRRA